MNRRQRASCRSMVFSTRALLTAGALAGASLLGACGDSPGAEAAKNANQSSDQAARLALSAGEARTTPEFAKKAVDVDPDPAKTASEINKLKKSYEPESAWGSVLDLKSVPDAKAGVDEAAKLRAARTYDDLKRANDMISKAAADVQLSPALKAALQSQAGGNSLAQARSQLELLDRDLRLLGEYGNRIIALSDDIAGMNAAAGVFESHKDAKTFETQKTELTSKAGEAQKAFDDATTKLAGLKSQKAEKERQAAELERKSEEQAAAADQIKPNNKANVAKYTEALEVARKTYSEAAALREEASVLDSSINAATTDVSLAEHQAREAKAAADAVADVAKRVGTSHGGAQDEAGKVRTRIGELVTGKEGINERIAAFKTLAADIETRVTKTVDAATAAQKAFDEAAKSQSKANADIKRRISENNDFKADDPMARIADKKDSEAALRALEAAAYNTQGQARLVGFLAAEMRGLVEAQLKKALEPAKQAVPADVASTKTTYGAEATESFKRALESAGKVSSMAPATSPAKWLADAAKAVANYGLSVAAATDADRQAAFSAAEAAAKEALSKNPTLAFPGLVAATPPAPSGGGAAPSGTKPSDMGADVPAVPETAPAPTEPPMAPG